MTTWQTVVVTCAGSGVCCALLHALNELMVELRVAREQRMSLRSIDYRELARHAGLAFILGLFFVPTLIALFVIGRVFLRYSWTGVWR